MNKNPFSLHVDLDDFLPATEAEKAYMVQQSTLLSRVLPLTSVNFPLSCTMAATIIRRSHLVSY